MIPPPASRPIEDVQSRRFTRGDGRLPLQNLLLGALVIAAVNIAAQFLNARAALFPFGDYMGAKSGAGGRFWLPLLSQSLIAVLALLSARGVAQLWLWPRRTAPAYGYYLWGASAALALCPQLAWDLLATQRLHWWTEPPASPAWEGVALGKLLGLLVINLIALLCAMPALINKHPHPRPRGLQAIGGWAGLTLGLLAGVLGRGSDAVVAVLAAPVAIVSVLAFRNLNTGLTHPAGPVEENDN